MQQTQFLVRPEGRISYDVAGDGPLVVASPGMGDLRSTYRFLAPALVQAGYRVATVDLRGHGRSSTGWSSYRQSDIAGDLLALVEHLGSGPAVVVANSFSGGAAVVAAVQRPDLVRGLVLSGAVVRQVPTGPMARFATWLVVRTPLGRPIWGAYVPSLTPGRRPADFDAVRAELKANLAEPGRWAVVAAMAGSRDPASEASLAQVQVPALVVMGRKDPDFPDPEAEAELTADRLGGPARVLMVDGVGHYPHMQAPETVTPAVLAFLAQLPATSGTGGS